MSLITEAPPTAEPQVVGQVRLRVTSPIDAGYYIADDSCRRGEIRVHPVWSTMSEAMPIAKARPILDMMGINFADARSDRRVAR